MKKLFTVSIIVLFLGIAIAPSTANPSPSGTLGVELIGGIGVKLIIKNSRDVAINNTYWRLSVKGGHFGLINKTKNGTICLIKPNTNITKRIFIFGFGTIKVSLWIIIPPQKPGQPYTAITGWKNWSLFGPYVYQ
jgi:hypothetical protein